MSRNFKLIPALVLTDIFIYSLSRDVAGILDKWRLWRFDSSLGLLIKSIEC